MTNEKVKNVPTAVRRWVEKGLGYKLPDSYELSVWAFNPRGRAKRIEKSHHESERRDRRLKRVAGKMRRAGLDEKDIQTVIRRGFIN